MHIGALLLKSKRTNDVFCISLKWVNNEVFGKDIAIALLNLENAFPCGSSNIQQRFSGAKK